MTNYVTPQTWEECARHVEAGGVVEIEDAPGVWINDRAAAATYRGRCGTPDDGWAPRRCLVPIESAARTGAERYLTDRMTDPEYAEAHPEMPDDYEVVVLPVETVDYCAKEWGSGPGRMSRVGDACRDAVARRPRPATERVPWWEAVGRRWPDGRCVWKVTHSVDGVIAWDKGGEALDVMFSADGTVEVLRRDGDR